MRAQPLLPSVRLPPAPGRSVRIEYLDFQNLAEHREFRFRVNGPDGSNEFRLRIPIAAFGVGRVLLQDGPDVCYQKLLRAVVAGEAPGPDVITIDEVELAGYRVAHTHVPKHRSFTPAATSTPASAPRNQQKTPYPPRRVPPAPVAIDPGPVFEEGQRIRHAIFGEGVTAASISDRTAVCFDEGGRKTFITSILEVEVLSAPRAWETSARGVNRPSRAVAQPAEVPATS